MQSDPLVTRCPYSSSYTTSPPKPYYPITQEAIFTLRRNPNLIELFFTSLPANLGNVDKTFLSKVVALGSKVAALGYQMGSATIQKISEISETILAPEALKQVSDRIDRCFKNFGSPDSKQVAYSSLLKLRHEIQEVVVDTYIDNFRFICPYTFYKSISDQLAEHCKTYHTHVTLSQDIFIESIVLRAFDFPQSHAAPCTCRNNNNGSPSDFTLEFDPVEVISTLRSNLTAKYAERLDAFLIKELARRCEALVGSFQQIPEGDISELNKYSQKLTLVTTTILGFKLYDSEPPPPPNSTNNPC